ncbi:mucin-5AC-like [Homalodisca vitripennis]|uniref:mucin-5AC-like n=1 Tax=Homalodisca vitripennis TaxID=197043 RepID=UPI001EEA9F57|nr:mucin-5AC-like [Homalodisca vitripennis]
MEYIEGSAPAPPDGESSLPGPLAALLDACAASKDSFSFGAPKGLSKGHFELSSESHSEARTAVPAAPATSHGPLETRSSLPAPAAQPAAKLKNFAQKGLLKGHFSRSAKTGPVTRPTVPAATGCFPGHEEATLTLPESTTATAAMFSDIAKKGLIKGHFSQSADSGTAACLTTPATSGASPGLQEPVQTPPMAAALPSTDLAVQGNYSLPQGNNPPGTGDQGPGVVRNTPETSHGAVTNGQGALSRSDVCSANSMPNRQATTDSALPSKCRRTAGDEMEVVREPRIPPVVLGPERVGQSCRHLEAATEWRPGGGVYSQDSSSEDVDGGPLQGSPAISPWRGDIIPHLLARQREAAEGCHQGSAFHSDV